MMGRSPAAVRSHRITLSEDPDFIRVSPEAPLAPEWSSQRERSRLKRPKKPFALEVTHGLCVPLSQNDETCSDR